MSKVIIFKNSKGQVCEMTPTPEVLQTYTVEQVAQKDVPHGVPYKIVDVSELPTDQTFRDAWEVDEALLTDGVGAESNEFPEVTE